MRKRGLVAFAALLLCMATVLCSCTDNHVVSETTTAQETSKEQETSTTQPETKPQSKYSLQDKLIALTFDDGPSYKTTNRILDILEENGGAATFFVVGYNIKNNISTIKRAVEMGCEIGNHSQGHAKLTECKDAELRKQVDGPNKQLKELAGVDVKLFRTPGGHFKGVESKIGMPIIQWNVDTSDWKYKDAANEDRTEEQREADLKAIADKVVNNAEKGDIVLMHDIYGFTADLCELIVPALVEKGFKLVTVSEMYLAYGEELKNGKVYYNIDTVAISLEPLEPGDYRVKTKGGVLNVRAKAEKTSESLVKLPNGTDVTVVKSIKGWSYVEYSNVKGWVNSRYLEKR